MNFDSKSKLFNYLWSQIRITDRIPVILISGAFFHFCQTIIRSFKTLKIRAK
jgi:hypothetical protein